MEFFIQLSSAQIERLRLEAERLGLKPEELARAAIADLLATTGEDFKATAERVLSKPEFDIAALTPEERLSLLEQLWDSGRSGPARSSPQLGRGGRRCRHKPDECSAGVETSVSPTQRGDLSAQQIEDRRQRDDGLARSIEDVGKHLQQPHRRRKMNQWIGSIQVAERPLQTMGPRLEHEPLMRPLLRQRDREPQLERHVESGHATAQSHAGKVMERVSATS
jgi:hypothetical protein